MADQDRGQAIVSMGFEDIVLELKAHFVIEGGQRFVQQE
jgi:hypothetical protein